MAKMKLKKRKDIIPGGLADKKQPSDFDSEALKKGLKVELEHTTDPHIAVEIAMDHLTEDPAYYDKLAKMEKGEIKEMKLKIKKKVLNENLELNQEEMTAPQDFAGEPDFEGQMAKNQMYKVHEYSKELIDMMTDDMQLPAWVQSKLTKIADYIGAVKHFIEGEMALKEAEGELSPKQKEIASKAPPEDKITADDFAELRKKKDLTEELLDEGILDKLPSALAQIKKSIPQLDIKRIMADAPKIISAIKDLKTIDNSGSLKEGNRPDLLRLLTKYGLLITGVAIVASQLFGQPKEVPNTLALKMIGMGLKDMDPRSFLQSIKGPDAAEFGFDLASGMIPETVVYEGLDEDGNTCMVEMFYEECGCGMLAEQQIEEAEYQGRKVPLNKPMRGDVKKFKVYVKDPSTGNVKKVNFGDKNMRIKKSNPARRKSFRARHNCDNPGPKTKARYWSCKAW